MQQFVVIFIVVAAALSAAWRLMGVASRIRLLEALARTLGESVVLRRMMNRQRGVQGQGACGSCLRKRNL